MTNDGIKRILAAITKVTLLFCLFNGLVLLLGFLLTGSFMPMNWASALQIAFFLSAFGSIIGYVSFLFTMAVE